MCLPQSTKKSLVRGYLSLKHLLKPLKIPKCRIENKEQPSNAAIQYGVTVAHRLQNFPTLLYTFLSSINGISEKSWKLLIRFVICWICGEVGINDFGLFTGRIKKWWKAALAQRKYDRLLIAVGTMIQKNDCLRFSLSEEFTEKTNVYPCGAFHFPLLLVPPKSDKTPLFDFCL